MGKLLRMLSVAGLVPLLAGQACYRVEQVPDEGDGAPSSDADSDSDVDTDADSDSDADTDGDADGDSDGDGDSDSDGPPPCPLGSGYPCSCNAESYICDDGSPCGFLEGYDTGVCLAVCDGYGSCPPTPYEGIGVCAIEDYSASYCILTCYADAECPPDQSCTEDMLCYPL
jgi:hypothetical protein